MDYKSFPIQDVINSGNIENSLNRIVQMQKMSGINFVESSTVTTPPHIVDDMLDMLPETVWNRNTRFLNLACKDGIFLVKIFKRLFDSKELKEFIADATERAWYILENQLFAVCVDQPIANMLSTLMYGMSGLSSTHITWLGSIKDLKNLNGLAMKQYVYQRFIATGQIDKKETSQYMNFDVVIGNPPYNNDLYLDFVKLGCILANINKENLIDQKEKEQHLKELEQAENVGKRFIENTAEDSLVCMITPAKWQAKGGKNNNDFRKHIVPYMKKITFWSDCGEVFDISEVGGISYYLLSANRIQDKYIKTISTKNKKLCSEGIQSLSTPILHNEALSILTKVNKLKTRTFVPMIVSNKYNLLASIPPAIGGSKGSPVGYLLSKEGMLQCLAEPHLEEDKDLIFYSGNYKVIYSSEHKSEVLSAKSYCYSKFIRFLIFCGLVGNSTLTDESWRYIPQPEAFDHIFTDKELYEKYKLTEEEINIIESVIKERK